MTKTMAFFASFRRSARLRSVLLGMAATQALTACTMIPNYKRPQPPLAKTWPAYQTTGDRQLEQTATDIGWRDFFTDPRLQGLIAIALRENRDLRSAAASITEAQGQYDVQHAGLFPAISASGGPIYQAPSSAAGLSFAPGLDQGKGGESYGGGHVFKYYQGGIGFSSYEIDLFGRIRSLSREAAEHALYEQENLRGMLISIVAQVAMAYITWLGDHDTLAVSEQTLATQQQTLALIRAEYQHGEATC